MQKIKEIVFVTLFLILPFFVTAQTPPPPPYPHSHYGGTLTPTNQPNQMTPYGHGSGVPINDGIYLLAIAGAIYGSKKLYDFNNKDEEAAE